MILVYFHSLVFGINILGYIRFVCIEILASVVHLQKYDPQVIALSPVLSVFVLCLCLYSHSGVMCIGAFAQCTFSLVWVKMHLYVCSFVHCNPFTFVHPRPKHWRFSTFYACTCSHSLLYFVSLGVRFACTFIRFCMICALCTLYALKLVQSKWVSE